MSMTMDLMHWGVGHDDDPPGRGSGRFAFGSGKNPGQHQFDLISEVDKLKKKGFTEGQIAKMLGGEYAKATDLKAAITIEKNRQKKQEVAQAYQLLEKYKGNLSAVARAMGKNESSLRSMLSDKVSYNRDKYSNTAEALKKAIEERGWPLDVSKDVELFLGCTRNTKDVAVAMLEQEGYVKTWTKVPQRGTQNETTITVLAPPNTAWKDIQAKKFDIKSLVEFTPDEGKTWWTPEFPESVSSKRVFVRYAEDGGAEKDGVIELRRDVKDLSLGGSQYAQVRIAVDGTNYMKGMAMYAPDDQIPKGYDIIYNTNKKRGTPLIDPNAVYNPDNDTWSGKEVTKRMKINKKTGEIDKDNPFGALIRSPKDRDGIVTAGGQYHYKDEKGNDKLSPINKLQDEGDWDSWSRNLSSQFLSKQSLKLINQQIDLSIASKKKDLEEIMNLTNPVIKKRLLADFADGCDANAADLSVKGFKNQAFQVILPIPDLKDNEIYAPRFKDGDTVALVRYPHGGTFEIPVLKVNNKHATARNVMRNGADAVGINSRNAEILSGADFDGDTVCVIPMTSNHIKIRKDDPLPELKNWDAKAIYKLPDDAPQMKNKTKQTQMGIVTNLITDMTVGGADLSQIARAVKHSMVVIDAEKHHLDYKQSARDNDIDDLKREFQSLNGKIGGATTILSKAKSKEYVDKRKEITRTSDMTPEQLERWNRGDRVWVTDTKAKAKTQIKDVKVMTPEEREAYNAGKKVYRETGKLRQEQVSRMYLVDDARELVRDPNNPKEMAYANYANELKDLARQARREYRSIKPEKVNQEAKKTYASEVESLERSLRIAKMNNPKERIAQSMAGAIMAEKRAANPDLDTEHRKREEAIAINQARAIVGAKKERVQINDSEWEAIQSNAISSTKLEEIVSNADIDALKKRATPRGTQTVLTPAKLNLLKAMAASGMYTQAEIAEAVGCSTSMVSNEIRKEKAA